MKSNINNHFVSRKLDIKERIEKGKLLKKDFPIEKLGEYKPAENRMDPVTILEEQDKTRPQELVPVRYARMSERKVMHWQNRSSRFRVLCNNF